jgi:hypothetical protein
MSNLLTFSQPPTPIQIDESYEMEEVHFHNS